MFEVCSNYITYCDTQTQLPAIQDVFPDSSVETLLSVLRQTNGNVEDAVDLLLHRTQGVSIQGTVQPPVCEAGPSSLGINTDHDSRNGDNSGPSTVVELLSNHIRKTVDTTRCCEIEVNREKLWRHALGFYKNSLHNPERLARDFHVEFEGEEGVDGGALKNDFFEQLLKLVNDKLFEGDMYRRIPKRDWSLEHSMEIAGVIVAHSLIHGGPAFPCLCPPVFSYSVYGDRERALELLPTKEDIPRNMATEGVWTLIEEVMHMHKKLSRQSTSVSIY